MVAIVLVIVTAVAITLFMYRTKYGEKMRALAAVMVLTTVASGVDYATRFLQRAFAQIAAA